MKLPARQLQKVLKRGAAYRRELDCAWAEENLIGLLNQESNGARRGVTTIVELCKKATQVSRGVRPYPSTAAEICAAEEQDEVLAELNTHLVRYKWHPALIGDLGGNSRLILNLQFGAKGGRAESENRAVLWLMKHIDEIGRVRNCGNGVCLRWFFAAAEHQKYCSDTCRKTEAAKGERAKEKRKLYMRKYRTQEAERSKRAKQLAKG